MNYNSLAPNTAGAGAFLARDITSTYDDIVHYRTKWQVVKEAGSVLSSSVCTTANTIIKTPDSTASSINYSYFCKDKPANANCQTYMNTLANKVRDLCLNQ